MLELGDAELKLHEEIGEYAGAAGVDLLIVVGPRAERIADRFEGESRSVPDASAAAELVPGLLRPGDVVLVKGSRGVGLELVCRALRPEDER
jgi:UDP-N-acetylmuramyl pentapeptide synthase